MLTPAQKYINDVHILAYQTSKFGINPDDDDEIVLFDECAFELEPIPALPDWVHFIGIRAFKPKKGMGSKGLKAICDLADKHKVTLFGKLKPFDTKSMTVEQLSKWYKKFKGVMISEDLCVRVIPETNLKDLRKIDSVTKKKIIKGFNGWEYGQHIQSNKRKTVLAAGVLILGSIFLLGR